MNLNIVSPIFGFEDIKVVKLVEIDSFFSKIESKEFSFTLIDPNRLRDYEIDISSYYKNLLKIESMSEVDIYCIVIISSNIKDSKINFAAPIIVNKSEKLLAQVVLDEVKYSKFSIAESISEYL